MQRVSVVNSSQQQPTTNNQQSIPTIHAPFTWMITAIVIISCLLKQLSFLPKAHHLDVPFQVSFPSINAGLALISLKKA